MNGSPFRPQTALALILSSAVLAAGPLALTLAPAAAFARAPGDTGYADLVERVSPAVVNISTKQLPKKTKEDKAEPGLQFRRARPLTIYSATFWNARAVARSGRLHPWVRALSSIPAV